MDKSIEPLDRRKFIQLAGSLIAGGTALAACGTDNTGNAKTTRSYFPGENPEIPDAYTAPPASFKQSVQHIPGNGSKVTAFTITFNPIPIIKSQNLYWQEISKKLNVDWNVIFASSSVYGEKALNLLASNDLPDLFLIVWSGQPRLITPLKQGAFTDLTTYLAGDALKAYPNLAKIPSATWKSSQRFGKIYGVPRAGSPVGSQLFIRYDWMEKVGNTNPQNIREFFQLCQEIVKARPDGKDTYALGHATMTNNFFYECYRLPNLWDYQKDNLRYYIEAEQFPDVLATIKEFWRSGLWHPDSFSMNTDQSKQTQMRGEIAAYFDGFGAYGQRSGTRALNPNADVRQLVPFGFDGGPAVHYRSPGYYGMASIPAQKGKDPERVKELLRVLDYLSAPRFSTEGDFLALGIDGHDNKVYRGLKGLTELGVREKGDLASIANGPQTLYFADEPQVSLLYQDTVRKSLKIGISNPVESLYSETAITKIDQMNGVNWRYFSKIIKGELPVAAGVTSWIKDWKAAGGEKMRQEYLAALESSTQG